MLLEREKELAAIGDLLAGARAGRGGVATIEAAAGLGKTRLLDAAAERAAAEGMRVLSARGFELERQFTFGVVRQLYEPAGADGALIEAAAARSGTDPLFAVAHGMYWLTADVAEQEPLLLTVDDAHWSDAASLRCLVHLADRIEELPAVLVVAIRSGEPGAPDELLAALAGEDGRHRITLPPLSRAATTRLIADQLGEDPGDSFAAAAHELTGGNPFYAEALAAELRAEGVRPDDSGARILPAVTPAAVGRSVLVRLTRLGPDAIALVRAVAVLGDGAALQHAAALAELDVQAAAAAADDLARADVLRPEQALAFTHPLVREAVHAETPAHQRGLLHAAAARILHEGGASIEHVGAQLLRTAPAGEAWAADRLAAAGQAALAAGDLESAVAFLRRAADEPPAREARARVLHLLGGAEVRAGDDAGYGHLDAAAELAGDQQLLAAIRFDQARGLLLAGRPEAVDALARASSGLPAGERGETVEKEVELIVLGRMSPATAPLVRERAAQLAPVAEAGEPGWQAALGALAGNAYLANRPATEIADLARRSLEGRRARGDDPAESAGWLNACYLLGQAGELAEAESWLTHAVERASRANALIVFAAAASFRAAAALRRGELARAEADARMALDAAGVSIAPLPLPATVGVLVEVLIERGHRDEADRLIADRGFQGELLPLGPFNDLAFARGRLRLAQSRPADALADLTAAGAAAQALGVRAPGPFPWRPWAAYALQRLGREDEARAMAADSMAVASEFGAARDLGIALCAAGAVGGDLDLLREAVVVLEGSQARLELARARVELGAALRRAAPRDAAREVLREALDGATACGATVLAERAHVELTATGAKPRRPRTWGVAALTAGERRVTELAAGGMTNRQIAEALFVTTKTVEKHLASAYTKLEISGRGELSAALEEKDGGGVPTARAP